MAVQSPLQLAEQSAVGKPGTHRNEHGKHMSGHKFGSQPAIIAVTIMVSTLGAQRVKETMTGLLDFGAAKSTPIPMADADSCLEAGATEPDPGT
nr:unnamed protein product [Digitaria exilis]